MNDDKEIYLNVFSEYQENDFTSNDMIPASVNENKSIRNKKLKIDTESLHETISSLYQILDTIKETDQEKRITIDTIKINLGVSASGKIGLLGTGVEIKTDANIELSLKYS